MGNRISKGFTLIELMVTIAIVGIMSSIAIPSFQNFIRQTRTTAQTNDFISALNYARSESIKQGRTVTLCKSADLATCVAAGNWAQGWILFIDTDGNGAKANAETMLRVHAAMAGGSSLIGGATLSYWVQYIPTGMAVGNGGATANGVAASQFVLCPSAPAGGVGRTIEIGLTGRIKSTSYGGCA